MKKLLPYLCALAGVLVGAIIGYAAAPEAEKPQPQPAAIERPAVPQRQPAPVAKPEPIQHDGQISGRVLTADGKPLAGVQIRATPMTEDGLTGATPEQELRALAEARLLARAAASEDDGSFALTEIDPARHYSLEARLDGWSFRIEGQQQAFSAGSEVEFTATTSALLRVSLRLPDGRAPHIGRIILMRDREADSRQFWTWTPFNTEYALTPGEWSLEIAAGEFHEFVAKPRTVSITPGKPIEPLEIQLEALHGIVGRVIPAAGMGDARLAVRLLQEVRGEFVNPQGAEGRSVQPQVILGMGWRFQFIGLNPGRYRLELLQDETAIDGWDVTLDNGTFSVELRAPEPDPNEYIVVRVSGPEGPIIRGLQFVLMVVQGTRTSSGGSRTIDRGDGEFWLSRLDSRFTGDDGWYVVRIQSRRYGDRDFRYERADRSPLEVVLEPPAFVVVEIVGFDEHPQKSEFSVHVAPMDESDSRLSNRIPGEGTGATRRFGPLEPGEYVALFNIEQRERWATITLDKKTVNAAPGDNTVRFTAPPLYSVTIEIPEQYSNNQISILDAVSYAQHGSTDGQAESEHTFDRLPPGEYVVMANPAGVMRVSLPQADGQRILFQPLPLNAYLLQARGRPSEVDIGLKDGDIVLAMDGNSLQDYDRRRDFMRESLAQETTTWTILRNGQRMNITFKSADWQRAGLFTQPARVD